MDLLKDAAKNLNLYEVKSYVRKAQNVAMNLTEMESKVREATNNEPWGASTTLMAQIAAGTYNYREREEIVAFTFRRFTEKAANEWRQIYKSLQLLDYLIRNGSERIIDEIRSNMSLIQMLKAKTLIALLNDDALIRSERKKARANAKKFGGVSSAAYGGASSLSGDSGSNFDDDYNGRVFGDGGVYGSRYGDTAAAYNEPGSTGSSAEDFEEYDEHSTSRTATSKPTTSSSKVNAKAATNKPATKAPEPDLLGDLLDFKPSTQATQADADDDDDFDDFQAAPSHSASQTPLSSNLASLYQTPQYQNPVQTPQFQNTVPSQPQFQNQTFSNASTTANYNVNTAVSSGPAKAASSNDAFSSLFSSAKTKTKASPLAAKSPVRTQADDVFSAPATNTNTSSNNNNNNNTGNGNSGEIDLLSF